MQNQTCHGENARRYRGGLSTGTRASARCAAHAQPLSHRCRRQLGPPARRPWVRLRLGPEHAVEVAGSIREARGHRYGAMRPPPDNVSDSETGSLTRGPSVETSVQRTRTARVPSSAAVPGHCSSSCRCGAYKGPSRVGTVTRTSAPRITAAPSRTVVLSLTAGRVPARSRRARVTPERIRRKASVSPASTSPKATSTARSVARTRSSSARHSSHSARCASSSSRSASPRSPSR